jgi:hypothetical protein
MKAIILFMLIICMFGCASMGNNSGEFYIPRIGMTRVEALQMINIDNSITIRVGQIEKRHYRTTHGQYETWYIYRASGFFGGNHWTWVDCSACNDRLVMIDFAKGKVTGVSY